MRHNQHVIFFPPSEVPALAAQKTHHLHHIIDLGLAKRGIERRHSTPPIGNNSSYLGDIFALHSVTEIGRRYR